jgi:hypothetical protein
MNDRDKYFALLFALIGVGGALIGMHLTVTWGPWDTYMFLAPLGFILAAGACIYGYKLDNAPEKTLVERILIEMGFAGGAQESFRCSIATVILTLACKLDGEPESMDELLRRLDFKILADKFGDEELGSVRPRNVEEVWIRCKALSERITEDLFGSSQDERC